MRTINVSMDNDWKHKRKREKKGGKEIGNVTMKI